MKEKAVFDDERSGVVPDDSESCEDLMVDDQSLDMAAVDAEEAASEPPGAGKPFAGPPLSKSDRAWLKQHRMAVHTSDDPVQPIRLHGRRVLQLRTGSTAPSADKDEFAHDVKECIPMQTIGELRDDEWEAIAQGLGMTKLETKVYLAVFRDQLPFYTLHEVLKCSKAQLRRTYRSIQGKLLAHPSAVTAVTGSLTLDRAPSSRHILYLDRMDSGKLVLSMGRLDQTFADVMSGENYLCLITEEDPSDSSAADEKAWFSSLRTRRAVMLVIKPVTQADIDAECLRLHVDLDKDFGSNVPQREAWIANVRAVKAYRNKLEAQEQERQRLHTLHQEEFQAVLAQCEAKHHDLMEKIEGSADGQEKVEGVRERIARVKREVWMEAEKLPAAMMSIDELGAALDKRAESGLKADIRELDKLEGELGENTELLMMLREEKAYRERQAQAKAVNKTAPQVVKAIKQLVAVVDGAIPDLSGISDPVERTVTARITAEMIWLKQYQARKGVSA